MQRQEQDQIFIPGYPGARELTPAEIARRDAADPLWFGCFTEFSKDPNFTKDEANLNRFLKDTNDYLHLYWNEKNFPSEYRFYPEVNEKILNFNGNLLTILVKRNDLKALNELFMDAEFCKIYEEDKLLKVKQGLMYGPQYSTQHNIPTKIMRHMNRANDAMLFYEFIAYLSDMTVPHYRLESQDDKDNFERKIREECNEAIEILRKAGKSDVANAFEIVWPNFTLKPGPPPKAAYVPPRPPGT